MKGQWQHQKFIEIILAASLAKTVKAACKEWGLERFGVIPPAARAAGANTCHLCNTEIWRLAVIANYKTNARLVIGLDCYDKLIQAQQTGAVASTLPTRAERAKYIRTYLREKRPDKTFLGWFKDQHTNHNLPREIAAVMEEIAVLTVPGTVQNVDLLLSYYKAMRPFPTVMLLTPDEMIGITNYLDIPLGDTITIDRADTLKREWDANHQLAEEHYCRWQEISRRFGVDSPLPHARGVMSFLDLLLRAITANLEAPADIRRTAAQLQKNTVRVTDEELQQWYDWCNTPSAIPARAIIANTSDLEYLQAITRLGDCLTGQEAATLWTAYQHTAWPIFPRHRGWHDRRQMLADWLTRVMTKLAASFAEPVDLTPLQRTLQSAVAALPVLADETAELRADALMAQFLALWRAEVRPVVLMADYALIQQQDGWHTYRRLLDYRTVHPEAVTEARHVFAAVVVHSHPHQAQWFGEAEVTEISPCMWLPTIAFTIPDVHRPDHFVGRTTDGTMVVPHVDTPVTTPGTYPCLLTDHGQRPYVVAYVFPHT